MLRNPFSSRSLTCISLGMLTLVAGTLVLMPTAAQADEGMPFKGTFAVQAELVTKVTSCAPGDKNCSACLSNIGFYAEALGIGETSRGTMFLEVQKCFYPNRGSFGTYVGIFTMTAPNGKDSITGTYSGQNDNAGDAYGFGPFSGELTITGGTGKFDDAHGSARFNAAGGPFTAGPIPDSSMVMAFYSVQGKLGVRDVD
jgi:hypothetical protein